MKAYIPYSTKIKLTISKEFKFDSAHSLPHLPSTHKCHNLHGHTYTVRFYCTGVPDENGFVIDYNKLTQVVKPIIEMVDHKNLNDLVTFSTTSENLAIWFYDMVSKEIPQLSRVDVHETPSTMCTYVSPTH